ncbi:protein FAM124B [Stigmatopora nigra]
MRAESTKSDHSSRMSKTTAEVMSQRAREQQWRLSVVNLHLLANPGDSLLLQHSLDRLLRRLCPSLHIFHVSERASPLKGNARLCPLSASPSLAITFFLHEAYGELRILKVLDFFQRPPWKYHHTESCKTSRLRISADETTPLQPYLLPSQDFFSLGAGMPVWAVRPVHCGGEILRVTLYSGYDNYEDAVRFYETVLQRRAEEQKMGFCWFTLHTEPGLCLQLALKQVSEGIRVEPCNSAVLQFSVEEIGQLVPLLPNPCTPISGSRWQTEDLDGNKVLFQVKEPPQPTLPLTCAFPLACPAVVPRAMHQKSPSPSDIHSPPAWQNYRHGPRATSEGTAEKLPGSQGSGSCCSSPPGSSCYSSQRNSPALPASDSPLRPPVAHSLSTLLPEEDEGETNVDTGAAVMTRSSSLELLNRCQPRMSAASCLSGKDRHPAGKWFSSALSNNAGNLRVPLTKSPNPCHSKDGDTAADLFAKSLSTQVKTEESADEFFI